MMICWGLFTKKNPISNKVLWLPVISVSRNKNICQADRHWGAAFETLAFLPVSPPNGNNIILQQISLVPFLYIAKLELALAHNENPLGLCTPWCITNYKFFHAATDYFDSSASWSATTTSSSYSPGWDSLNKYCAASPKLYFVIGSTPLPSSRRVIHFLLML